MRLEDYQKYIDSQFLDVKPTPLEPVKIEEPIPGTDELITVAAKQIDESTDQAPELPMIAPAIEEIESSGLSRF